MKLDGIHHITAITGDAPANVDFYTRVLGLRMAKKTVNQDDPTIYHLFYADEQAQPGADLTFFEYPGAAPGHAGAGMVHRIAYRVGSEDALDFWAQRLADEGIASEREGAQPALRRPRGPRLRAAGRRRPGRAAGRRPPRGPRRAGAAGLPRRARVRRLARSQRRPARAGARVRAQRRRLGRRARLGGARRRRAAASTPTTRRPTARPIQGAGTVHHVAWNSAADDHEAWRERVIAAGGRPTPVIDRFWFRSIYFREPSGVLFELATPDPGFTVDESLETLGEKLVLPPAFEPQRERIEAALKPLPYRRGARRAGLTAMGGRDPQAPAAGRPGPLASRG